MQYENQEIAVAVYLVTWNLNKEGAAYNAARERFVGRVGNYDNVYDGPRLDTVCFVSTTKTASEVYADLGQALDQDDRIVVTQMRAESTGGWLSAYMVDWINARL
jgi:hypothetical protein